MRVAVGLSGGVDSSVALALLKRDGHDVFGVTMTIWDKSYTFSGGKKHACLCSNEDEEVKIAKRVCEQLKVEHRVIDLSKEYKEIVLKYFSEEYIAGRTPNPCVLCNHKIKFGLLLDKALESKYDSENGLSNKFATGHYVNVSIDDNGRYCISKNHTKKDQSYFLCRLNQMQLVHCIFPLGDFTKDKVRELARELQLPTSEIKDSQNFYSGDYRDLIEKDAVGGAFLSDNGIFVGRHKGYWNYTIGQRIEGNRYVKEIDACKNIVVVSDHISNIVKSDFSISDLNFVSIDGIYEISLSKDLFVKVRSSGAAHKCTIDENKNIHLQDSATIISPGQFAVFYDINGFLLFSGVIKK